MVQVLLPARLLQEAAACAALGAALGAVRAFLPVRGRTAFVPDMLLSGAVLLVCQSYAAGYSAAGVLRWYMVLAAFAAAQAARRAVSDPPPGGRRRVVPPAFPDGSVSGTPPAPAVPVPH